MAQTKLLKYLLTQKVKKMQEIISLHFIMEYSYALNLLSTYKGVRQMKIIILLFVIIFFGSILVVTLDNSGAPRDVKASPLVTLDMLENLKDKE